MTDMTNEVSEAVANSVDTVSNEHVTVSLTTYRTYGAFDEKGQIKGVKGKNATGELILQDRPAVMAETQTKKNWEGAESNGATILNENSFKFYTLADEAGFASLVPSAEQRLYIIQKGLDALQTAAANKIQVELNDKKDKEDPDVLTYNGDTIDLREAINKAPEKKNLTPMEKFTRAIGVLPQDQLLAAIEKLKQQLLTQSEG